MTSGNESSQWKLDRHIPIAVILTILTQSVMGVWWLAGLQHAVDDHERRIASQEAAKIAERIAVVESQIRGSHELQIEMNHKLDKLMLMQGGAKGLQ